MTTSPMTSPIPMFAQPTRRRLDPLPMPNDPEASPAPAPASDGPEWWGDQDNNSSPAESVSGSLTGRLRGLLRPAQTTASPHTAISTDGQWSPEAATALAVGLLSLAVAGVAFAVRLRTQGAGQLRKPTSGQLDEIARPLSSIAYRHLDLERWGGDIADAIHTIAATGAYAGAGPLIEPAEHEPSIPENLNDPEGTE
jgi:hypothetical protein